MNKKDKELEGKIVKDYESGKFKELKDKKSVFQKMASDTKDRINLRLDPKTKEKFLKKSEEEGIPYQTLINSVLKKYIEGKLVDSSFEDLISQVRKEIKSLKKGA